MFLVYHVLCTIDIQSPWQNFMVYIFGDRKISFGIDSIKNQLKKMSILNIIWRI